MMKKLLLITRLLLISSMQLFARMMTCQISGTTDFSREGDTVTITVSQYTGRLNEIAENYSAVIRSGRFGIAIPAGIKARYVQLLFNCPESKYLPLVLLFPGDNLAVSIKNGKVSYTGPSAARFIAQQHLQDIADRSLRENQLRFTPATLKRVFAHVDSAAFESLDYLDKVKEQIGPTAWRLLGNDAKAAAACTKLGYFNYACMNKTEEVQENFKYAFLQYGKPFNCFPSFSAADDSGYTRSGYSIEYICQQYLVDSCFFSHKKFNIHEFYLYASKNFSGEIREQLLAHLFIVKRNNPELAVADISGALDYVKNKDLRMVLNKISATNTVGGIAPGFTLVDMNNRPVSLIDFRGKLVLLDFWFTGCGACKDMAPRMFAIEKKYAGQPIVFITICVDKKREQWLATLKTNEYTSPLSINLYTEGKGQTHTVIRDFDVRGFPTFILIDRDGKFCPKPALGVGEMSQLIDSYL
jgi:thiol-disulfide isomerase/thioredoxin